MGKRLIICEKPSVAKSIAAVLGAKERKDGFFIGGTGTSGEGYIIAWCFGHLLELAAPDAYGEQYAKWRYADLPIIPDKWQYVAAKDKSAQLKILKELLNRADVGEVINGCDSGREGELIFRLVYEHAKCRKPIKRLWISSMEDSAIRTGFNNLKDGAEYDDLYNAALCRSQADWAVGVNATRLFSVLYNVTLNTGRVQSPTLAMLVKREAEIKNFVKQPFYTAELDLGDPSRAGRFTASSERFDNKAAAERVIADCSNATVKSVTQTEKSVAPPKLYDLTTIQREANRAYGFTAQQTLDYTQSLYEKKLATYPRVDSRYLTDDMAATVEGLVRKIAPDAPCDASQVLNSKKVSDHHAIIPTAEAVTADISALPSGEREILQLLKTRLICAVGEKHRYLETAVTLESGGTEFKAKGKVVLHNGWKDYTAADVEDNDGENEQTATIPEIAEGQTFPVAAKLKEGFTSPPKHYTEDTLLSAMENAGADDMPDDAERKGLGTPATRAATVERIIKAGFVVRQKKNLLPTDKGINLIAVLPNTLTSAKLTADWEHKLLEVQRGELAADEFMANIEAFTKAIVLDNNKPNPEFVALFPDTRKAAEPLGKCPRCGADVSEGAKGFFCEKRDCGFKLWKESKFWTTKKKPLTAAIVKTLLKDGRVVLKGLFSEKTGRKYDATVILDDSGNGFVNFKMEFTQGGRKSEK